MNPAAGSAVAPSFDRELTLAELLDGALSRRLGAALEALVGLGAAVVDDTGKVLAGTPPAGARVRAPLSLELEPVGFLVGAAGQEQAVSGAAALVEQVLRSRARYLLAAEVHVETVRADYEELKARHADLQASEARFRALSEELERRVRQQVLEIEAQQRQLYQAEKLASIGQLAAGVAHEINNPIGFVRSNLSTARAYLTRFGELDRLVKAGPQGELKQAWEAHDMSFVLADFDDLLKDCVDGLDRVARIVRDLKGFSNVDRPEEEEVDINDNLRAAANVIAGQLPAGVQLRVNLEPLPRLLCLPGHLNQVFLNVLTNAIQAVGSSGEIGLSSVCQDEQIRVRVRDTGSGIAPENLARVFDPFYTTREPGKGTGLGLTVARDIVQAHGGRIELDSRPGEGTTVTISLPV